MGVAGEEFKSKGPNKINKLPSSRVEVLDINKVYLATNNRKKFRRVSVERIAESVRDYGLIEPVIVERRADGYELHAGQKRFLAHLMANVGTIKARVFRNLTEEQRIAIQLSENIYEMVPLHQVADAYWSHYRFILIKHLREIKIDKDKINEIDKVPDYWKIDKELKKIYTIADFCKRLRKDAPTIRAAFRYQRLHPLLKKQVEQGITSYSVAAEIARIKNKNEQIWISSRIAERGFKIVQKKITEIIYQKKEKHFELYYERAFEKDTTLDQITKVLSKTAHVLNGYRELINIEKNVENKIKENKTLEILRETKRIIESFELKINENSDYLKSLKGKEKTVRRGVKEMIIAGDVKLGELRAPNEYIKSRKIRWIPIRLIDKDPKNIRKTYDKGALEELAGSMKEVGQLEPIIVKPTGKRYRVVVGHRRLLAAKRNGWDKIMAIVANLSDEECREIQFEEAIKEMPLPEERAEGLRTLFELRKRKYELNGRSYTLNDFEKGISWLSSTTVRKALKFFELDERIKQLVREGLLEYTTALELFEIEDKSERYAWALRATAADYSVAQLREILEREKDEKENYPTEKYSKELQEFWKEINQGDKDWIYTKLVNNLAHDLYILSSNLRIAISASLRSINGKDLSTSLFTNKLMIEKFHRFKLAFESFSKLMSEMEKTEIKLEAKEAQITT